MAIESLPMPEYESRRATVSFETAPERIVEKRPELQPEETPYVMFRLGHLLATAPRALETMLSFYAKDSIQADRTNPDSAGRNTRHWSRQERRILRIVESGAITARPYQDESGRTMGVELRLNPSDDAPRWMRELPRELGIRVTHSGKVKVQRDGAWIGYENTMPIKNLKGETIRVADHRVGTVYNMEQSTAAENNGQTYVQQESADAKLLSHVLRVLHLGERHNSLKEVSAALFGLQAERRLNMHETIALFVPEAAHASLYQMPDGAARISLSSRSHDASKYEGSIFVAANGEVHQTYEAFAAAM